VVSEGIETEAQRDALVAAGCTLIQGYLTGRPMPAEDLGRMLASARASRRQGLSAVVVPAPVVRLGDGAA
jgi:predicted signal transduction protein with EAL and GGDEF domain